jgi:hypothetical protein
MNVGLSRNTPFVRCFASVSADTRQTRTVGKWRVRRCQVSSVQGCSRQEMPY